MWKVQPCRLRLFSAFVDRGQVDGMVLDYKRPSFFNDPYDIVLRAGDATKG